MNKYESGVNYMDTEMIDLKALINISISFRKFRSIIAESGSKVV